MIDLQLADDRWAKLNIDAIAERVLGALDLSNANVSLLATNDVEIAQLNEDFRDKPKPTNVLSWPSQNREPGGEVSPDAFGDIELGDIALAYETCVREAKAQDIPLEAHATHLILHGVLHLLGYDHETDDEAAQMESFESQLMLTMGLHDPYTIQ